MQYTLFVLELEVVSGIFPCVEEISGCAWIEANGGLCFRPSEVREASRGGNK